MKRIVSFVLVVFVLFSVSGCKGQEEKPILKVATTSSIGLLPAVNYYIIYDNAEKKRISNFEYSEVNSNVYIFSDKDSSVALNYIDVENEYEQKLEEIAQKILTITSADDEILSVDTLYVFNNDYYFDAHIKHKTNSYRYAIYEYKEHDDSFRKLATFDGMLSHVEKYND